jgi:hypothetical protein
MSYFTFLLENMLWSFLPWILFFLMGLIRSFWKLLTNRFWLSAKEEFISTGGFFFTYCILARSQAQLPHYIFVVFPLAAIVTAVFLHKLFFTDTLLKWRKPIYWFHSFLFTVLWIVLIVLMRFPFKQVWLLIPILAFLGLLMNSWLTWSKEKNTQFPNIIASAMFTMILVNLFLSTNFYPNLLQYQMGNTAADFINKTNIDKNKVVLYGVGDSRALHFYGQHIFTHKNTRNEIQASDFLITSTDSIPVFKQLFPQLKVLHTGANFSVSLLTAGFLNPETREAEMLHYVILDLDGKP